MSVLRGLGFQIRSGTANQSHSTNSPIFPIASKFTLLRVYRVCQRYASCSQYLYLDRNIKAHVPTIGFKTHYSSRWLICYIPCRDCVCGPAWSSNWKNRTSVRNLIERDVPFCALQQGLVLSKVQITAPQRARICPVGVYIAILCSPRFCIDAVHFQLSIHQSTLFHGCNSLFDVNSESQRDRNGSQDYSWRA